MNNSSFLIFVTAHNPLDRFDVLLKTLRGYSEIPGVIDVFIYIDSDHAEDKTALEELLKPNVELNSITVVVAEKKYEGFSLTWAHKPLLKQAILSKMYDYYIYTENDMLFSSEHFLYWHSWKDRLKSLNLEPGFCRFEKFEGKSVPFDNHRVVELNVPTRKVWGDIDFVSETVLTPNDAIAGFVTLSNPYMGMMILDQDMANVYVDSFSADPVKSFERVQHRCWPIADRSSLGTAFENLLPGQDHKRAVPVILDKGKLRVAPYAMLEHLDTKYSVELNQQLGSVLDISEIFGFRLF